MEEQFSQESVNAMIAWLPKFKAGDFIDAEKYYKKTGQNLDVVNELNTQIHTSGFIMIGFDWIDWMSKEKNDLAFLESADMETLRKLLTVFARLDRFSGGSFASKCTNGHIEAVIERIRSISID